MKGENYISILLVSLLILITFMSQEGVFPKINGLQNQNYTNLELIGDPIGRTIDYDTDGKIDVIWFDQQVNVLTAGLVDATDFILKYSANNTAGYVISSMMLYNTSFDNEIIFEFPEVGQNNFSFWLGSRTLLDFIGSGWNATSFSWQPVISPLYSNMTPLGTKIIGSETSIAFSEQAVFNPTIKGLEIISPSILDLSSYVTIQRNLSEEYTWSYNLQTGVGVSSIGYPIGLGSYISNSGTVIVNITGLMNNLILKAKIDGGKWSDEFFSEFFYSDLFIPKYVNSSTLLRVLHEPTNYWELIGNNNENAEFQYLEFLGTKFVGYNVSLNTSSGSTDICWKSSSLYYLPAGVLYSYKFDYIVNGSSWGISILELTDPSINPPDWIDIATTVTTPVTTTSEPISTTNLTTTTELNTMTTKSEPLETSTSTSLTTTETQSSENGLSLEFSLIIVSIGFMTIFNHQRKNRRNNKK